MKNILGQAIYMTAVLLIILMAGEYFIPEDCYVDDKTKVPVRFPNLQISFCTSDGYVRTGRKYDYSRNEDSDKLYSKRVKDALGPSRHYTVLYTTFVLMQLFNQINARKLTNELNIFAGFFGNYIAVGMMAIEFGLQIILTEFSRDAFSLCYKANTHVITHHDRA